MTYIIPNQSTKELRQLNQGDLSGEIFIGRNISLDDEGYISLAPPMVAFYSTTDDGDFDQVDAQGTGSDGVWAISDDIFKASGIGGTNQVVTNRISDTSAPAGNIEEDYIYFNGTDVMSDGTAIKYRSAATTWTSVALSLNATYPTCLALFDGANSVMVGNKNLVKLVDTNWVVTATLTIPDAFYVTSVCSNGSTGYVATKHIANGVSRIFTWDGVSGSADNSFPTGSFQIFSIKPHGASIIAITSSAEILRFNGGGFDHIGQLPPYLRQEEWADSTGNPRVSHRGFITDGNIAYLMAGSEYEAQFRYRADFPGGLYCLDDAHGLYHKHGPSLTTYRTEEDIATSSVNTTTNVITVTTAPSTGDQVVYLSDGGTPIAGLRDRTRYYAINVSGTTFKLATTRENADAGTAIDLTGTGNNSQDFVIYSVKDYGWSLIPEYSSITTIPSGLSSDISGRYVTTATLYSTSGGSRSNFTVWNVPAILADNRGYIVTPRLSSFDIEDGFANVAIKHRPLEAGESIVVKYRVAEKNNMPIAIPQGPSSFSRGVWSSATVFTTLRDLSSVSVGDEVEIVSGLGSGCLAHVSTISESSGTYTVTLDETIPGAVASDDMDFVIDNWTKIYTIESDTTDVGAIVNTTTGLAVFPVSANGKFLQLKIEMRGRGRFVEEVQVGNQSLIPLLRDKISSQMV